MMHTIKPTLSDTATLIHNERVKLSSDFMSRIGFGLIVISFLPIYLIGLSFGTVCWMILGLISGLGLIEAAYKNLGRML